LAKGFINISNSINTTSLTGTTNIVTPVNGTTNIPIGIEGYQNGDILEVYMDNVLLYPIENYTLNADGISIDLVDNSADGTNKFMFHVIKGNVIQSSVDWSNITNKPSFSSGNPLDIPPTTPSAWDDDFTSTTLNSKWQWLNQGTATYSLTDMSGFLKITKPTEGINLRTLVQDRPVGDFTVMAKVTTDSMSENQYSGIILVNSDTGYHITIGIRSAGSTSPSTGQTGYSNFTGSGAYSYQVFGLIPTFSWVKVVVVGTTAYCYYSTNGLFWSVLPNTTITVPTNFNKIGVGLNAGYSSNPSFSVYCDWFRVIQ